MTEYREHYSNVSEHLTNHNFPYLKEDSSTCLTSSVLNAANIHFLEQQHSVTQIENNLLCQIDEYHSKQKDESGEKLSNDCSTSDTAAIAHNQAGEYLNEPPRYLCSDEHNPHKFVENSDVAWMDPIDRYRSDDPEPIFNAENEHQNNDHTVAEQQNQQQMSDALPVVPIASQHQSIETIDSDISLPKNDPINEQNHENDFPLHVDPEFPTIEHLSSDHNQEENETFSELSCGAEDEDPIQSDVPAKPRKRRRRIVLMNDDNESDENDDENEREQILSADSPKPPPTVDETENSAETLRNIVKHEKPGPKSKKQSTQILKVIQARELLRTAVVIPAADNDAKKRKPRTIGSDDEEEVEQCPFLDLEGIGIPDAIPDRTDEDPTPSILLNENDNFPFEEGISIDKVDKIVPIENPIIPQYYQSKEENQMPSPCPSNRSKSSMDSDTSVTEEKPLIKIKQEKTDDEWIPRETKVASVNLPSNRKIKKENIKNEFLASFHYSSSSEEEEYIPNEVYFGTPDKFVTSFRGRGRPRGRPRISNTSLPRNHFDAIPAAVTAAQQQKPSEGRSRGRPATNKKFIDNRSYSSSESDSDSSSSSSSGSGSSDSPNDTYHKGKTKIPIKREVIHDEHPVKVKKKKQKNRFTDKSRNIPNDIYFGDVQVPLHVLYSYGKSSNSDSSDGETAKKGMINRKLKPTAKVHRPQPKPVTMAASSGRRGRPPGRPASSSGSSSSKDTNTLKQLKKFLRAAGMKKVKYGKLWQGCSSKREKGEKIMELLREKGLKGEPTLMKCKQLKQEILAKKEIEDLDTNLILSTEGRTRRSARAATHRNYTFDDDDLPEATTKWKKVIDSDSDFD